MKTPSPIARFQRWLADAKRSAAVKTFDACTLSSIDEAGFPDGRVVLLKEVDARGFTVYTNFQSSKGKSLLKRRKASLTFFWDALDRQVRVRGSVKPVAVEEADAYFATRPRESQIGAWASLQSAVLPDRATLLKRFAAANKRFDGMQVPRPPFWSGFRLAPKEIEFWSRGEHRLHHRELFTLRGGRWTCKKLYP